jgi:hypothetical protein
MTNIPSARFVWNYQSDSFALLISPAMLEAFQLHYFPVQFHCQKQSTTNLQNMIPSHVLLTALCTLHFF